jgi:hypothetical protein
LLATLRAWKRPLQIVVAISLLGALYWAADWRSVATAVANLNPLFLLTAWALFVPQTLVSSWRWGQLVRPAGNVPLTETVRVTLAAAAYNLVLPSKLGDVSKLSVVPSSRRKQAIWWLALEKGFDVASLLVLVGLGLLGFGWMSLAITLGLIFLIAGTCQVVGNRAGRTPAHEPRKQAGRILRTLARWAPIACSSAVLWCLHMLQIDLFCKAAGVFVAGDFALWRIPLAIFAGLVPFTLWGLGTRDAALVGLFAGVAPTATMATVGLLTATRYLIPGAAGIPFVVGRSVSRQAPAAAG